MTERNDCEGPTIDTAVDAVIDDGNDMIARATHAVACLAPSTMTRRVSEPAGLRRPRRSQQPVEKRQCILALPDLLSDLAGFTTSVCVIWPFAIGLDLAGVAMSARVGISSHLASIAVSACVTRPLVIGMDLAGIAMSACVIRPFVVGWDLAGLAMSARVTRPLVIGMDLAGIAMSACVIRPLVVGWDLAGLAVSARVIRLLVVGSEWDTGTVIPYNRCK